jgi:hypothetical protein
VLRLWPDTLHVGLFVGHGWVQRGKEPLRPLPAASDGSPLTMLAALLEELKGKLAPRTRVVLTVSDSLAAITTLPWHPQLQQDEELHRFAQLCFEQQGREVDASWAMHAAYRHFGAAGMAWALPRTWLLEAERIVVASGARLVRVQPATAAACQLGGRQRGDAIGIFLLRETTRCTALRFDRHGFVSLDVEPVTTQAEGAVSRILRRVAGGSTAVSSVACWDAGLSDEETRERIVALVARELPDVAVSYLTHEELS